MAGHCVVSSHHNADYPGLYSGLALFAAIATDSVTRTVLANDNGQQLACFLHGPGGSGKSTIINLVLAYAKEYCVFRGHKFTSRTIVFTAI